MNGDTRNVVESAIDARKERRPWAEQPLIGRTWVAIASASREAK